MKINSITINNFQSYYGEQTIEFGDGLNLVIGNGGKGKSKLFNAFYWVLFGKIYVTSEGGVLLMNCILALIRLFISLSILTKRHYTTPKLMGRLIVMFNLT